MYSIRHLNQSVYDGLKAVYSGYIGTISRSRSSFQSHKSGITANLYQRGKCSWIRNTRNFGSQSDVDVATGNVVKKEYGFIQDRTPEKLLELTATYWRRLRCAKALLLTCNVDKAIECRVVESVLATGAKCLATSDPNELMEKSIALKEQQRTFGCYINIDSLDAKLNLYRDAYESLGKLCDSVVVDVNVPIETHLGGDFKQIDQALSVIKPSVVRFLNGTWNYVSSVIPSHRLLQISNGGSDMEKLERANIISERLKALVIDCDTCSVMMNASNFEGVIFTSTPGILRKIYGFDMMAGGVISSMLSASGSNAMLGCITSIIGIDYSSERCKDISDGPSTIAVNFIDKIHTVSTSPDNLLNHGSAIRFMKRVKLKEEDNESCKDQTNV